jgi:hypothetical protein
MNSQHRQTTKTVPKTLYISFVHVDIQDQLQVSTKEINKSATTFICRFIYFLLHICM